MPNENKVPVCFTCGDHMLSSHVDEETLRAETEMKCAYCGETICVGDDYFLISETEVHFLLLNTELNNE